MLFLHKMWTQLCEETINLRSRIAAQRSDSKILDNVSQEVSVHVHNCAKGFYVLPLFKIWEENKIGPVEKEDHFIDLLKPNLSTINAIFYF